MKFEYTTLHFPNYDEGDGLRRLDKAGDEGWEVVCKLDTIGNTSVLLMARIKDSE